jgi:hypothetical protein
VRIGVKYIFSRNKFPCGKAKSQYGSGFHKPRTAGRNEVPAKFRWCALEPESVILGVAGVSPVCGGVHHRGLHRSMRSALHLFAQGAEVPAAAALWPPMPQPGREGVSPCEVLPNMLLTGRQGSGQLYGSCCY